MNDATQDGPLFTEDQLNLAADNYEAQETLVDGLRRAYEMSGMTRDDLARELELSAADAQAWIEGDVDLHLSQLRHLANAIDAKVTYKVSALRTKYKRKLHGFESTWTPTDWDSSPQHTMTPTDLLARHR
jgi:ribosome-binding protein aMBF1 (putative translation factor)